MAAEGVTAKLSISQCFARGFQAFGEHWLPFVLLNGVYFAFTQAADWGQRVLPAGTLSNGLSAFDMLIALTYSALWAAMAYFVAAGQRLDRRVFQVTAAVFPAFFRLGLLLLAAIFVVIAAVAIAIAIALGFHAAASYEHQGTAVAIALAILLLAPLQMTGWLLIETGMGVRTAVWTSLKLSRGNRFRLMVMTLPMAAYLLLSLLPEGSIWKPLCDAVGDIVIYPIADVALACAYFQLRSPEATDGATLEAVG